MFPLPLSVITLIAGAIFGASVSWYVMDSISVRKERDALQKIETDRAAERERNYEIATKHSSDLFQVLDYYRRNPVTVRLPSRPCNTGESPGGVDVPADSVTVVVGGVKQSNGEAVD